MSEITLRKYHGLGNDYLVYDPNRNDCLLEERQVEALCRRNIGVGADGILYGPFIKGDELSVRIFNPDGSEAEKSGNGIRIFSRYLKDAGYVTEDKSGKDAGDISRCRRRPDAGGHGVCRISGRGDPGGGIRG